MPALMQGSCCVNAGTSSDSFKAKVSPNLILMQWSLHIFNPSFSLHQLHRSNHPPLLTKQVNRVRWLHEIYPLMRYPKYLTFLRPTGTGTSLTFKPKTSSWICSTLFCLKSPYNTVINYLITRHLNLRSTSTNQPRRIIRMKKLLNVSGYPPSQCHQNGQFHSHLCHQPRNTQIMIHLFASSMNYSLPHLKTLPILSRSTTITFPRSKLLL